MIRPFLVVNGIGEYLGSFADWESAHQWAHHVAALDNPTLPIEVEDRAQRMTRRVTPTSCDLVAWTIFTKIRGCTENEAIPRIPPHVA